MFIPHRVWARGMPDAWRPREVRCNLSHVGNCQFASDSLRVTIEAAVVAVRPLMQHQILSKDTVACFIEVCISVRAFLTNGKSNRSGDALPRVFASKIQIIEHIFSFFCCPHSLRTASKLHLYVTFYNLQFTRHIVVSDRLPLKKKCTYPV
jgi:hypothetical protein